MILYTQEFQASNSALVDDVDGEDNLVVVGLEAFDNLEERLVADKHHHNIGLALVV